MSSSPNTSHSNAYSWLFQHLAEIALSPLTRTDWKALTEVSAKLIDPAQQQAMIAWYRTVLETLELRDPAARSMPEHTRAQFTSIHIAVLHKLTSELWPVNKDAALVLTNIGKALFGAEIHPSAHVADGVIFDHATGTVIGATAKIDRDCNILHNVTLGNRVPVPDGQRRHPLVGNNVVIGTNAKVLGPIILNPFCVIAAGTTVFEDVPAFCVVVGTNEVTHLVNPITDEALRVSDLAPEAGEQRRRFNLRKPEDASLLRKASYALHDRLKDVYGTDYADQLPGAWQVTYRRIAQELVCTGTEGVQPQVTPEPLSSPLLAEALRAAWHQYDAGR